MESKKNHRINYRYRSGVNGRIVRSTCWSWQIERIKADRLARGATKFWTSDDKA